MSNTKYTMNNESGNVLFLILIAVALFAALSYAVTQSTRSGGGSADRETSILNSASMTQYPASLRTSLIRMILAGENATQLAFDDPSLFPAPPSDYSDYVFHPEGGGGVYQRAPNDIMDTGAGNSNGVWTFNGNFTVSQIGTDVASSGNDIIAFLPGISLSVCESINDSFAIDIANCTTTVSDIPDLVAASTGSNIDDIMLVGESFPGTAEELQGEGATCEAFTGQPSGCFTDTDASPNRHVFFSTLLER